MTGGSVHRTGEACKRGWPEQPGFTTDGDFGHSLTERYGRIIHVRRGESCSSEFCLPRSCSRPPSSRWIWARCRNRSTYTSVETSTEGDGSETPRRHPHSLSASWIR